MQRRQGPAAGRQARGLLGLAFLVIMALRPSAAALDGAALLGHSFRLGGPDPQRWPLGCAGQGAVRLQLSFSPGGKVLTGAAGPCSARLVVDCTGSGCSGLLADLEAQVGAGGCCRLASMIASTPLTSPARLALAPLAAAGRWLASSSPEPRGTGISSTLALVWKAPHGQRSRSLPRAPAALQVERPSPIGPPVAQFSLDSSRFSAHKKRLLRFTVETVCGGGGGSQRDTFLVRPECPQVLARGACRLANGAPSAAGAVEGAGGGGKAGVHSNAKIPSGFMLFNQTEAKGRAIIQPPSPLPSNLPPAPLRPLRHPPCRCCSLMRSTAGRAAARRRWWR